MSLKKVRGAGLFKYGICTYQAVMPTAEFRMSNAKCRKPTAYRQTPQAFHTIA